MQVSREEAEKAYLGGLLLETRVQINKYLGSDMFHCQARRKLFSILKLMQTEGEHRELPAVVARLQLDGEDETTQDAISILPELIDFVPTGANFRYYERILISSETIH